MNRRTFLGWGLGAAAGLTLAPLLSGGRRAHAATASTGPLLISLHAGGGWDPLFLTDPKPDPAFNRVSQQVGQIGAITFSDHVIDPEELGFDAALAEAYSEWLLSNRAFFQRWGSRTTVFNGVDTKTVNHETGTRFVWSGKSAVGNPALGAMVASLGDRSQPLGFLSAGGYDYPGGLVPLSRVGNLGAMQRIIRPNAINPDKPQDGSYHSDATLSRIRAARAVRLHAQQQQAGLPAYQRALADLEAARAGVAELARFELPDDLVDIPGNQLNDVENAARSVQVTLATMKAGFTRAASLSMGGFDTHGNHDRDHVPRLAKLLGVASFALAEAERQGLADRLWVVIGSDFGRGPYYNGEGANAGKDHWANTSMIVAVPPGHSDPWGGRQIGGTNDSARPRKVSATSLAVDDGGVALTPSAIHRALRDAMGLGGSDADRAFPIPGDALPLFG